MARVARTVQYRYLNRSKIAAGAAKLEDLLREALLLDRDGDIIGQKARARIADLNQSGQLTLWNGLQGVDPRGVLAGELILYKDGFDVPAIEEKLDEEENRFQMVRFQTDGKNKPVEGALYFAVIGDHLGIIQSNHVTGRWLERYFTWLLKDVTSIIEGEAVVALDAKVGITADDLKKIGPARELTVHANSEERVSPDKNAPTTDTLEPSREFRTKRKGKGGTVIEILGLMGLGKDAIESIRADVPPGGSLEGDFIVYIKKGRKREQLSLGSVDHVFRNAEPGDIELNGKGSSIRGSDLTFSEAVKIGDTPIGLDPNEAIEAIIQVLYRWAKQGIINLGPTE